MFNFSANKKRPPSEVLDQIVSSQHSTTALGVDDDSVYLIDFDLESMSRGVRSMLKPDDKIVYSGQRQWFIVADWNKGLICQSALDGRVIWRNQKAIHTTHLRIADDESSVAVSGGSPPRSLLLDITTGTVLEQFEHTAGLFVRSASAEKVLLLLGSEIAVAGHQDVRATWGAFSVLDGLFIDDSILLSGPEGTWGLYQLPNIQAIVSSFCPVPCVRILPICYARQSRTIFGVVVEPYAKPVWELFAFDTNLQNARRIGDVGFARDYSFIMKGDKLCTTGGKVFNTSTCELVKTLNWPELYRK